MKNLNIPAVILKSKCIGHYIDFKWSQKKRNYFLDCLGNNEELENKLSQINHKASVALTAALLEWVLCRFSGYGKAANDIEERIESLWFSCSNFENTKPQDFDLDLDFPSSGSINGPIWIALMTARMVDMHYRKGTYFIQNELSGLVLLVRHITPKKKVFDKWFDKIILELSQNYPSEYKYDVNRPEEDFYDSSSEPAICREFFFDPKFEYTASASEKAINKFIKNLDYNSNPFIYIPEKAS
ncbi:hypothetical protein [Flavobacterium daemonense]|uniref:hypothetical protein n=1 Tax=Flavobacterium daemonense TaxID=1393049 RepID=UPI001186B48C|nr:hypothetical protein [Flavobacterium daemonense]KAF2329385.1 hypothetical protein FND99_16385 [Flavobacterium daemonense]